MAEAVVPAGADTPLPAWFDHGFVAAALANAATAITGGHGGPYRSVTTNSRAAGPGDLFVALKGERFDGHAFIAQAFAQGAAGAIGEAAATAGLEPPPGRALYRTADSLAAFRALAGAYRRRYSIPVVAVAGSAGKTTSKDMLAALLGGRWERVLRTSGSQNGFIGIPMTLLGLRPDHGAAVIEVGIDDVDAMAGHIALVDPDAALLTCVAPEHLERLGDLETVAREEFQALEYADAKGGLVLVNLDDPAILARAGALRSPRRLGFRLWRSGEEAKVEAGEWTAVDGQYDPDHERLRILPSGLELDLPLPGEHNARNLLGAVAAALGLGLFDDEIRRGLAGFRASPGRSEVRRLARGNTVICDYYNANPGSMREGLRMLARRAEREGGGRRLACLADMLELGRDEERYHRELAPALAEAGVDRLFLYGPRMAALAEALKAGPLAGSTRHFLDKAALSAALSAELRPGDVLLLKGSRGMRMEEVREALEGPPAPT